MMPYLKIIMSPERHNSSIKDVMNENSNSHINIYYSCIFVDNFGISIVDRLRYNSSRGENYRQDTSSDGNIIKYNRNRGQNQENQVLPFRKLENLVCISETAPKRFPPNTTRNKVDLN